MKHNDWWLDKACYSWYRLVPLIVLHFKHRKFEDTKHCGNIRLSSAEMILLVKHFLPMKIKKIVTCICFYMLLNLETNVMYLTSITQMHHRERYVFYT